MEYAGYLFTHFIGEQKMGEQVYFSLSKDGLNWDDRNNRQPVLISNVGELGARDPFILRNPLTGKFVIIASDLRIEAGKGWTVAELQGSKDILVWQSEDLVNWEGPVAKTVGVPYAGCVWAPEAIYDENEKNFMVFFASKVKEEGDAAPKQKIFCTRTTDFETFGPTEKYMEGEFDIIDTTMMYKDGMFYRFFKDETNKFIRTEMSSTLDKDSFVPFKVPVLENLFGVEGPEVYQLTNGEYCLIVDRYAEDKGYLPMVFTDPASGEFRVLEDGEYHFGEMKKRHGGILPITKEEYDRVAAAFPSNNA